MTLREALKIFKTKTALAKALNIKKQNITSWEMDEPIPENHRLKLQYEVIPQLERDMDAAS